MTPLHFWGTALIQNVIDILNIAIASILLSFNNAQSLNILSS